jgi:hypothetical protein
LECKILKIINIPGNVKVSIDASAIDATITTINRPTTTAKPITSITAGYYTDNKVTTLVIPASVTSIGNEAFQGFANLKTITIPNSVKTIGNNAFNGCINLGTITIPDSVTSIGVAAFYNCTILTSVTFAVDSKLTMIGNGAFKECWKLTSISIIPRSVTSIGNSAFESCSDRIYHFERFVVWLLCGVKSRQ